MVNNEDMPENEEIELEENPVMGNIAEYIIQALIKEDVNAFAEAELLYQLLSYKLQEVAPRLMYDRIKDVSGMVRSGKKLDLVKRAGGITQVKKIAFRTTDQYNAFVSLFFNVMEGHPELVGAMANDKAFEDFMIYCIFEFKESLDEFATSIAAERLKKEQEQRVYSVRSKKTEQMADIPTYADYIADRIDGLASRAE